ncbi:ATP-binding cassette domain-containing protein [Asanoa iriomotensis]|uniref:ATP-binding cassette domain-containing protein n=1 Tax=Asanoa iriomotensis TaxID=234613 RepID=UPI001942851F|nr:ATP-binding cassette domain-containing protein [Asanoa iriomotensis]
MEQKSTGGFAIEAEDLVKSYGEVRALQGLTFSVPAGGIFSLLGPNGAGKSTTVKILTTLSRADSGRATVAGHDVGRQPNKVRRAIGYVSQKSAVDPEATGVENLTLQGQLYGLRGAPLKQRVAELLDQFHLTAEGGRLVRTYSGGMQRKLHVGMGLLHRPSVLFLDEPTIGLDPEARAEIWQEISRLATDEGLTVLLTTHYLDEADRLADRIAIVDAGKVVVEGTSEELKGELRGDTVQFEFAEPPNAELVNRVLSDQDDAMSEIKIDGRVLRARVGNGATALPATLAALTAAGATVAAATVSRPSLDDVYLRYTGRAFHNTGNEVPR